MTQQDHPHVPHYTWPGRPPGSALGALTPEERAAQAQHAEDRLALEAGHTLRLWLAVPLVLWSFIGVAVFVLVVLALVLGAAGVADITEIDFSRSLAQFLGLAFLLVVASVVGATLLIRDLVRPRSWLLVLVSSLVAATGGTLWALQIDDAPRSAVASVALAVYLALVAALQLRRSVRLSAAARRSERFSP